MQWNSFPVSHVHCFSVSNCPTFPVSHCSSVTLLNSHTVIAFICHCVPTLKILFSEKCVLTCQDGETNTEKATGTRAQEHKNSRQSEMNSFCQQCYRQINISSTMTVRPLKLVVVIVYKYCICYIIITLHTLGKK